jgi:hypothetical protein
VAVQKVLLVAGIYLSIQFANSGRAADSLEIPAPNERPGIISLLFLECVLI